MRLAGSVVVVSPSGKDLTAAIVAALTRAGAEVVVAPGDDVRTSIDAVVATHERVDGIVVADAALAPQWLRAAGPVLATGGGGSITTVVTTRALAGDDGGWDESASGGAAVALTLAAATTYGKGGVRANAIAIPPADLDADRVRRSTLLPRSFDPADAAALVVFLVSGDAAFVTGQCLRCDGGLLAHLPHYATLMQAGTTTTGG